jgi:GT2 family glycosyltransferase
MEHYLHSQLDFFPKAERRALFFAGRSAFQKQRFLQDKSMPKVLAFTRNRHHSPVFNERDALHGGTVEAGERSRAHASTRSVERERTTNQAAVDLVVSVVVPTCGRPQLLNRCVASLVLQGFDPERFEIIIVDDRPGEDTRQVGARWAEHTEGGGPRVTYIPSFGPHGPAAARNIGWRAARGGIIAFTDDDTIAGSDWLENGLRAFDDHVHAVWGRIVMPLSGTPTDYQLDAKGLETAVFVTANCFVRRHVLEQVGGFDERFRYAWREDSDLYFRLLDYPANIVHAPKAVVTHPIRPAGWGVSLSQLKKIQFDALLYKKHPGRYREKVRAKPRWDFYFTVAALVACLAGIITGATAVAMISGVAWLFMTSRFCLQRLKKTSRAPAHVAEMIVTSILIPPMAVYWRAVGALKFRVGFL